MLFLISGFFLILGGFVVGSGWLFLFGRLVWICFFDFALEVFPPFFSSSQVRDVSQMISVSVCNYQSILSSNPFQYLKYLL